VLPPLTVIEILSQNDHIPLFVVKDYISKLLKEAYGDLNASQEKINSLRQSTAEMRAEVMDLKSTARVFQVRGRGEEIIACLRPMVVEMDRRHSYYYHYCNILILFFTSFAPLEHHRLPSAMVAPRVWTCQPFISCACTPIIKIRIALIVSMSVMSAPLTTGSTRAS